MSKPFCFLLFCALLPYWVHAQTDRSALLQEFHRLDTFCEAQINNKPELVVGESKRLIELAQRLQVDSLIVRAHLLQGESLANLGIYDAALKSYYTGLSKSEQIGDCKYHSKLLFYIGRVYQSMEDPAKSIDFIRKARQRAIDCRQYQDTILYNYEIGFDLVMMDDTAAGMQLVRDNVQTARKLNSVEDLIYGLDNLSNLSAGLDNDKLALQYELELMKIPQVFEDNTKKTAFYEHLSEIYFKLHDLDNAQKYQRLCMKYAFELGSNDWIFEAYKLQYMIDEARGNYKSALFNHKKYLEIKDSVYQVQYHEKMAAMSSLYELETKQKTIELLKIDQKLKENEIAQQRILLLLGLLSLIIVVLMIRFRNQRKTNAMRQAFAQDLLKVQETERQRISKDLHDSVGQNILFIKNQLHRLVPAPDQQLVSSVDSTLEEVRNIAKDLYPNQLEQYGLQSAVDSLCETVQETSGIFVSSDLQGIDAKLNREAKINFYRIIQECINNAMKHAGATSIRITSKQSPGKLELVVQDNGKGFDKSILERKAQRSFGMINMEERIKMLRGKFDLETAVDKGVKLTFSIPV
jgi:signal transduction histidine kinase